MARAAPGAERRRARPVRPLLERSARHAGRMAARTSTGADEQRRARRVADYIAGMTDRYALDEHRRLFDAHPGIALGAPPARGVSPTAGMPADDRMNIFADLQRACRRCVGRSRRDGRHAGGPRPRRASWSSRRAIPAHGDIATNAAMVLAKDAGQKPARRSPKRIAAAPARRCRTSPRSTWPGPGFINLAARRRVLAGVLAAILAAGGDLRPRDRGGGSGQCRVRLGQSDRADACRPLPRRRVRRRAGQPAGLRRLRGDARVLHQRCRRAGRRARAAPPSCATARRWARRSARSRRGSIPATI